MSTFSLRPGSGREGLKLRKLKLRNTFFLFGNSRHQDIIFQPVILSIHIATANNKQFLKFN